MAESIWNYILYDARLSVIVCVFLYRKVYIFFYTLNWHRNYVTLYLIRFEIVWRARNGDNKRSKQILHCIHSSILNNWLLRYHWFCSLKLNTKKMILVLSIIVFQFTHSAQLFHWCTFVYWYNHQFCERRHFHARVRSCVRAFTNIKNGGWHEA